MKIGDTLLADTTRAIELGERGYPVAPLPTLQGRTRRDVVWSYEQPLASMQAIAQHLAFDDKKVIVG
ncbi:DUF427 domain-containing protein [Billgrantia sp. LNSP4103-1]|uniref:DUF427 domain-containing protein n=1 Tax=Billgrantia sp. LNSP4103-1 TaxID=3410266 RepID=UPI00403F220D